MIVFNKENHKFINVPDFEEEEEEDITLFSNCFDILISLTDCTNNLSNHVYKSTSLSMSTPFESGKHN